MGCPLFNPIWISPKLQDFTFQADPRFSSKNPTKKVNPAAGTWSSHFLAQIASPPHLQRPLKKVCKVLLGFGCSWFLLQFTVVLIAFWYFLYNPDGQNPENFRIFSCKELKSATNGFHSSNKLGEGGFGSVYKVFLSPATSNSAYIETSYIYVCVYIYINCRVTAKLSP